MKREPPAAFSDSAMTIDRVLTWRGERQGAIVFVERPGRNDARAPVSYVLVPSATRAFRDLLLGLGFGRASVEAYLQQPVFELDQAACLALAASPQICIDVRLRLQAAVDAQGRRQEDLALLADDTRRQLVEASVAARSLAAVGSANLSLGTTRGRADAGTGGPSATIANSLNFAARGVMSRGNGLLQYDVTASHDSSKAGGGSFSDAVTAGTRSPRTLTRINLLAAGTHLELVGGTAYAGVFQSGIGTNEGGGTPSFLADPAILGVAWKSDGGDLSAFGRRQRVRLHLLSPSYVRIVSQGAQLFEGVLQPGERIVSFTGYGQPFVDVIARDANGAEQRQRAEVLPAETGDAPTFDQRRNPHGFYADIGKPTLQNVVDGATYRRFQVLDQTVMSFGHAYAGAWGTLRSGIQSGKGFTRVATSLASRSLASQASLMRGTHGERGLGGTYQPVLASGWQPAVTFTDYRTSQASYASGASSVGGGVSGVSGVSGIAAGAGAGADCRLLADSLQCYSPTNYRSTTLGVGHRDWPLRLTYTESRSDSAVSRRVTLQANLDVHLAGRHGSVLTMLGYEPNTRAKSLLVVWVLPLDAPGTMVTSSGSTDLQGGGSVSAGYSQTVDPATHDHLRSHSLNASGSRIPGDDTGGMHGEALAGYASSQFGPVSQTTSLSVARNATSLQAGFAADYAFTGDGASFTRENRGSIGSTRLFESPGAAGVAVANRSQEPQTALIDGASVDVPPGTNVYVPVTAGYLSGVTVSPGPALGEEQAKAGQYLYKGNVKSVVIADGFWVMARFDSPGGRALPVQFTSKQPGDRLERLYLDSRLQAILFELREDAPTITRFVTTESVDGRPGDEYRCTVPQAEAPRPDQVSSYRPLRYACTPLRASAPSP